VQHNTDAATNAGLAEFDRQPTAIRVELEQQRGFRVEQLQELMADAAEAIATLDEPRLEVTRVLKMAAESALAEIEAALRRLEQGIYGTCEHCARPIPWERLEVLPMAALCTGCQWRVESDRPDRGRGGSFSSRIQCREA